MQAIPLTVEDIKNIVKWFNKLGNLGLVLTAATLIGFYTFLCQSNLLFSMSDRYLEHGLRDVDVNCTEKDLFIQVCSSKTVYLSNGYVVRLPVIKSSKYCPVRAWRRYRCRVRLAPGDLAFTRTDGKPLLANTLLRAIQH